MAYATGLPAFVLIKVLAPSFFARQDTATPVKIALVCVFINLVLNIVLMQIFSHVGIALATAISAWVNVFLLSICLRARRQFTVDTKLKKTRFSSALLRNNYFYQNYLEQAPVM